MSVILAVVVALVVSLVAEPDNHERDHCGAAGADDVVDECDVVADVSTHISSQFISAVASFQSMLCLGFGWTVRRDLVGGLHR